MSGALKPAIRVDGKSMYCGPAALMAVSGWGFKDVRSLINRVRGFRPNTGVRGLSNTVLERCLDRIGLNYKRGQPIHDQTLGQWLKDRSQPRVDATIIVNVTNHYVTVKGHMLVDNHTDVPVYVWSGPHLKRKVKRYWVIKN